MQWLLSYIAFHLIKFLIRLNEVINLESKSAEPIQL